MGDGIGNMVILGKWEYWGWGGGGYQLINCGPRIIEYAQQVFNQINQWSYRIRLPPVLHQQSGGFSGLSIPPFTIIQMSHHNTQFIINLTKLPNGYAFLSLDEPHPSVTKKKSAPKSKPKNSTSRTFNHRIARELALDLQASEQLPSIHEEPEPLKKLPLPEPLEQISVEIKRQNGLPDTPAQWFDETGVHHLEREGLAQFFDGKSYKSPQLYMKYRNFMVGCYRRNPNQYLTKCACRRVLRGDVTTIMRVHTFLEKVGLINFGISKDGDYSFASSIYSRAINSQPKIPTAISKLPETDEERTVDPIDNCGLSHTFVNKCFSKSYRVFCSRCHSICGIIWYQSKVEGEREDSSICLTCYKSLSPRESESFTKMDTVKRAETGGYKESKPSTWSIEDNMHLLEFVSKPQSSWEPLQKETFEDKKSLDEIMLQFMQFPITNFEQSEGPKPTELTYLPEEYTSRLLNRFKASNPAESEAQAQNEEANRQFCKGTKEIVKKICTKYETRIGFLLDRENLLQDSIFELKSMANCVRRLKEVAVRDPVNGLNPGDEEDRSSDSGSSSSKDEAEEEDNGGDGASEEFDLMAML